MNLSVSLRKPLSPRFTLDVTFSAAPGITMLFGASGSGKTTLLRCLAGLLTPDAGRIAIGERLLFNAQAGGDVPTQKRHIGYVFQQLALFPHMSVTANIEYGLHGMAERGKRERTRAIAESFRIAHLLARRPDAISGGERQRVALARSLVTDPDLLLLDEPLSALDAAVKSEIVDDLRAWNASRRLPILYVTHSREEVDALGERVVVLDRGRVVASGTPRDVLDAPRLLRLAQAAGFENLLDATVLDLREADGVMRVQLEGSQAELEVPLAHASPSDRVRVAIRAGDILLATQRPAGLSARNVLPGKILSLELRGVLAVGRVDCGAVFTVHLTPGACRNLALAEGREVWLVVKTHSCHLVHD